MLVPSDLCCDFDRATICRYSQPLVGLNNTRSEDDENLVSLIRAASGEVRAVRHARSTEEEPLSPMSESDPEELIRYLEIVKSMLD